MKKLLILGAGQYGLVAKEIAEAMGVFSTVEFLDDHSELAVGKLDDLNRIEYDVAFVAIGDPSVRCHWMTRVKSLVTLVHPRAVVSPSASVGEGSIIEAGAVVSADAVIGKGTIVMANAVVGHNATVGDCCQLRYGCAVSENITVPDMTKVECMQNL